MKHLFTIAFLFLTFTALSQYTIDKKVRKEYLKIIKRLPKEFVAEISDYYPAGMGLLYVIRTDTLNRNDFNQKLNSVNIYGIDPTTGEVERTKATQPGDEQVSKDSPYPLSCNCAMNNDTLIITSGINFFSGFTISTKIYKKKIIAFYSEIEQEPVLQRTLAEEKTKEIVIPAQINFLMLDKRLRRSKRELFGQVSITTDGYYNYRDVYGFKTDYIHKRMKFEFYFRCDLKSN